MIVDIFDATMIVEGSPELTEYEGNEDDYAEACQVLIDSGVAWQLQGSIGRACAAMLLAGICHEPELA